MAARGLFVAGTDTGVGKTLMACAILRGLAATGQRVVGMKPVAAGAVRRHGALCNEDVVQLRAAGNVDAPAEWLNPYCFAPPIAPHIAAREAGSAIRMTKITGSYARLAHRADVVVVEGAGGLLVPLGRTLDMADIPERLDLPVVLVVGLRLGCLNHALLTVEALRTRNLRLAAWIANQVDRDMSHVTQNLRELRVRIKAPQIGMVKYATNATPESALRGLDIRRLNALI